MAVAAWVVAALAVVAAVVLARLYVAARADAARRDAPAVDGAAAAGSAASSPAVPAPAGATPAEAPPVAADPEPDPDPDPDADPAELAWALAAVQLGWRRREEQAISTAPPSGPAEGLAGSLAQEVQQRRELAGTPGQLELDLGGEPGPAWSLATLAVVQALLDAVARRCDEFRLSVSCGAEGTGIHLVGDGFDGDATALADLAQVLALVDGPAGGARSEVTGASLTVRVDLPAAVPAGAAGVTTPG